MNKTQLKSILFTLILPTAIAVDAGAHERGRIGHVVDLQPVYETKIVHRQVSKTRCHNRRQTSGKRVHDAVLGSLIGAVIGNEMSSATGFCALGAAVGLGLSESRYRNAETCETVWLPERRRVRTLSHYAVSVAHWGRVVRLQSEHPYHIGEHISFAR